MPQIFPTLSQPILTSPHLSALSNFSPFFSPLITSSQLFTPLLTSPRLFSVLLNSSQLFLSLLNFSHLFSTCHIFLTFSQLVSPLLTFSQLVSRLPNSSQLFLIILAFDQLFSTRVTSRLFSPHLLTSHVTFTCEILLVSMVSRHNAAFFLETSTIFYACSRSTKSADAATPLRYAEIDLQNTIEPWCSHSNTIYKVAKDKRTTHAAVPRNLDAAVPMHKVAECEQNNEKSPWDLSSIKLACRAGFDATARVPASAALASAHCIRLPEKKFSHKFEHSNLILNAAVPLVPLRSTNSELQNTIESQDIPQEHVTLCSSANAQSSFAPAK